MLSSSKIQENLLALFSRDVDGRDIKHVTLCDWAFTNLANHFVEATKPQVRNLIRFDTIKTQMMIRRFHRDAYGLYNYTNAIKGLIPDQEKQRAVFAETERLSIRINTDKPRKTRIAAAFSLWMSTFKPMYFIGLPSSPDIDLWRLEAETNFFIATSFLSLYGFIEVGKEGEDRRVRLERITYDFTFRDLNLSSLEMLYCSIFRPHGGNVSSSEV